MIRTIAILALTSLICTLLLLTAIPSEWGMKSAAIVLTVVLLGVYTYGHFNNNRLDLFDHHKGVKLSKTQSLIVNILEYKIPTVLLGIYMVGYVVVIWSVRIAFVLFFIYWFHYALTH